MSYELRVMSILFYDLFSTHRYHPHIFKKKIQMNLMQIRLMFIGIIISSISYSQGSPPVPYTPRDTMHYFTLGSTIIPLQLIRYGTNRHIVIINLHDDETTSVEAAKNILQDIGGLLIKIDNKNQRLVSFILNKKEYTFDPNRIFSKKGIIATLKKNKAYSDLALKKVQAFASFILKKIPGTTTTLIAVHNNDDGRLSIHSYQKGGDKVKDVKKINIGLSEDPDNFYFTTDKDIFKRLAPLDYNVILQENKKANDDGSLSIYYGRRNMSYVNVEVTQGQAKRQSQMIKSLFTDLKY